MIGSAIAGDLWSSEPEVFRFSPRANSAHKIQWRLWGEEAFEEATLKNKPIFLVISSSWCSWCHLMDETTLSESTIITIVNKDYIPIRVDSDLRPDVNQRYNQNGWPSVALLSSEGEILWGGVYVPPKQMLYYLGYIRRYYSENRKEIAEQVTRLREERALQDCPLSEGYEALRRVPGETYQVLSELYDSENGGFSIHPHLKFPHPEALELLLYLGDRGGGIEMVDYSLRQMRDGGLWDGEGGGFFRYSAASDWSAPHTEKMLEENAALLRLVLFLAEASGEPEWYEMAKRLLFYCSATLWQPEVGVFAGSQSADDEYYEPGPYSRASREAPHVDRTVYAAWNARMISSYLLAARILKQPVLRGTALRALHFLCKYLLRVDGGVCHYTLARQGILPGLLSDQVWLARALLDAYESEGSERYQENALSVMQFACEVLFDKESSLFFDVPENPHAVGRLVLRDQPLIENALAAECLLRLAEHSGRQEWRVLGKQVLVACLEKYRNSGIQGTIYAWVVAQALRKGWLHDAE